METEFLFGVSRTVKMHHKLVIKHQLLLTSIVSSGKIFFPVNIEIEWKHLGKMWVICTAILYKIRHSTYELFLTNLLYLSKLTWIETHSTQSIHNQKEGVGFRVWVGGERAVITQCACAQAFLLTWNFWKTVPHPWIQICFYWPCHAILEFLILD